MQIEMWNVHGVQLNLGYIVGTDHGICSWSSNDYTFYEYDDSSLFTYREALGIEFVEKDLQHDIEYIDQFKDIYYMGWDPEVSLELSAREMLRQGKKKIKLSDFAISSEASPRTSIADRWDDKNGIYAYLFICYMWLKHNKTEDHIEYHRFASVSEPFFWNGIIHTTYEDGKLKATYVEFPMCDEKEPIRTLGEYTGYLTLEDVKVMIVMEPEEATNYLLNLLGINNEQNRVTDSMIEEEK